MERGLRNFELRKAFLEIGTLAGSDGRVKSCLYGLHGFGRNDRLASCAGHDPDWAKAWPKDNQIGAKLAFAVGLTVERDAVFDQESFQGREAAPVGLVIAQPQYRRAVDLSARFKQLVWRLWPKVAVAPFQSG